MTPAGPHADASVTAHNLWTITRICRTLNHSALERRFLQDLTHAPEPDVMSVFTAWRKVAATIEQHAQRPRSPQLPQIAGVARTVRTQEATGALSPADASSQCRVPADARRSGPT
jgi:hypothetical protein